MTLQAFIRRFAGDFKNFAEFIAEFPLNRLNSAQIGLFKP